MSEIFLFILLLYALAGIVPLCIRKKRIWEISSLIMGVGGLLLVVSSLLAALHNYSIPVLKISISALYPVTLGIDRLSAVYSVLLGILTVAVSMYTPGYLDRMHGDRRKYLVSSLIPLFLVSMLLVIFSQTLIAFLVFWEIMAILSFFLVLTEYEEARTRYAAIFYLAMTQLSTVFIFLGIILLTLITGTFAYPDKVSGNDVLIPVSFFCLFIGIAIKSGVIPFHKWLTHAHPAAPSPVSALMSGMMISTALYALVRVLTRFYETDISWGYVMLVFGCLTAVLGVMYALKEQDLKGLLAYSSIDNTGVVLIGLSLWVIFGSYGQLDIATMALVGAIFHSVSHGIFKGLLFLTAGSVCQAAHTRNIDELGGILVRMPSTGPLFFIGILSISAIPPFSGFIGELLIYQALIGGLMSLDPYAQVVMIIALALFGLTGGLTVTTFVKAFGLTFLALPRSSGAENARETPFFMVAGPAVLAGMSIVLGVCAYHILGIFGYPGLIPDLSTVAVLLLITTCLVYGAVYAGASQKTKISRTWDCGMHAPGSMNEYTGSGFTEPVVRFFSPVFRTKITVSKQYHDSFQCLFRTGEAGIYLMKFFEECLYLPVARGIDRYAGYVSGLQNGSVDRYVLYVFLMVIALIIVLGWSS